MKTPGRLTKRGESKKKAHPKNRERLEAADAAGRLAVALQSQVQQIEADQVALEKPDGLTAAAAELK